MPSLLPPLAEGKGRRVNPDPKPSRREKPPRRPIRRTRKPATSEAEREARLRFKVVVLALDGGCVVHDDPLDCSPGPLPLEVHHVVSRQQLRKAGRTDLWWSPENGIAICARAHRRHTLAVERIPRHRLPDRCVEFAREHGFAYLLARYYSDR